jgi:hypothetical protein
MTCRAPGLAALFVAIAAGGIASACSDTSKSIGSGNKVIVDGTYDGSVPREGDDGGYADGEFAPSDASYTKPDGYAALAICQQCACPAGSYCFGGGTGKETFAGSCAVNTTATLQVGCNTLPTACQATPSCECIMDAIKAQVPCYMVCSEAPDIGRAVYCPVP